MGSSNGVISGSNPCFRLLPPSLPDPVTRFAQVHMPKPRSNPARSVKMPAAILAQETATDNETFYEILGIPESGSISDIKQAYKELARRYHPDVSPSDRVGEYTHRFIRIQEAYKVLSDPNMRAMYDRDLRFGFSVGSRRTVNMGWKNQWEAQLSELKRRSKKKEAGEGNMSWRARSRRQRFDLHEEE